MWETELEKYLEMGYNWEVLIRKAYLKSPKRDAKQDGLISEVLLDLLFNCFFEESLKLKVRAVSHHSDKYEIKGPDLMYVSCNEGAPVFWIGQAKAGTKSYCSKSIVEDLQKTVNWEYISEEILITLDVNETILDVGRPDYKQIISTINRFNSLKGDENKEKFREYLINSHVKFMFPCLVTYTSKNTYKDLLKIHEQLKNETEFYKKLLLSKDYNLEEIPSELIMFIFPLKSLENLRSKKEGVYAGFDD